MQRCIVGRRKPPTKMCGAKSYRYKMHGTFGRSNRRFRWKNKPMGLWCGSHNDGGKASNAFPS